MIRKRATSSGSLRRFYACINKHGDHQKKSKFELLLDHWKRYESNVSDKAATVCTTQTSSNERCLSDRERSKEDKHEVKVQNISPLTSSLLKHTVFNKSSAESYIDIEREISQSESKLPLTKNDIDPPESYFNVEKKISNTDIQSPNEKYYKAVYNRKTSSCLDQTDLGLLPNSVETTFSIKMKENMDSLKNISRTDFASLLNQRQLAEQSIPTKFLKRSFTKEKHNLREGRSSFQKLKIFQDRSQKDLLGLDWKHQNFYINKSSHLTRDFILARKNMGNSDPFRRASFPFANMFKSYFLRSGSLSRIFLSSERGFSTSQVITNIETWPHKEIKQISPRGKNEIKKNIDRRRNYFKRMIKKLVKMRKLTSRRIDKMYQIKHFSLNNNIIESVYLSNITPYEECKPNVEFIYPTLKEYQSEITKIDESDGIGDKESSSDNFKLSDIKDINSPPPPLSVNKEDLKSMVNLKENRSNDEFFECVLFSNKIAEEYFNEINRSNSGIKNQNLKETNPDVCLKVSGKTNELLKRSNTFNSPTWKKISSVSVMDNSCGVKYSTEPYFNNNSENNKIDPGKYSLLIKNREIDSSDKELRSISLDNEQAFALLKPTPFTAPRSIFSLNQSSDWTLFQKTDQNLLYENNKTKLDSDGKSDQKQLKPKLRECFALPLPKNSTKNGDDRVGPFNLTTVKPKSRHGELYSNDVPRTEIFRMAVRWISGQGCFDKSSCTVDIDCDRKKATRNEKPFEATKNDTYIFSRASTFLSNKHRYTKLMNETKPFLVRNINLSSSCFSTSSCLKVNALLARAKNKVAATSYFFPENCNQINTRKESNWEKETMISSKPVVFWTPGSFQHLQKSDFTSDLSNEFKPKQTNNDSIKDHSTKNETTGFSRSIKSEEISSKSQSSSVRSSDMSETNEESPSGSSEGFENVINDSIEKRILRNQESDNIPLKHDRLFKETKDITISNVKKGKNEILKHSKPIQNFQVKSDSLKLEEPVSPSTKTSHSNIIKTFSNTQQLHKMKSKRDELSKNKKMNSSKNIENKSTESNMDRRIKDRLLSTSKPLKKVTPSNTRKPLADYDTSHYVEEPLLKLNLKKTENPREILLEEIFNESRKNRYSGTQLINPRRKFEHIHPESIKRASITIRPYKPPEDDQCRGEFVAKLKT